MSHSDNPLRRAISDLGDAVTRRLIGPEVRVKEDERRDAEDRLRALQYRIDLILESDEERREDAHD